MRFAFEAYLPVPVDQVEARFALEQHGAVIACGVPRDALIAQLRSADGTDGALSKHTAGGGAGVTSVRPAALPVCVLARLPGVATEVICRRLEFRAGVFESPPRRRHRRRLFQLVGITVVIVLLSLSAGMLLDAARLQRRGAALREASRAWADAVLPAKGAAAALEPSLRLEAELRRVEQTRDRSAEKVLAEDRLATLIGVLSAWPRTVKARVETLQVDQNAIVIRGLVREALDYEKLTTALKSAPPGWSAPSGGTSSLGSAPDTGYSFNLAMHRAVQPPNDAEQEHLPAIGGRP